MQTSEDERVAAWWNSLDVTQRERAARVLDGPVPDDLAEGMLRAGVTLAGSVGRGGVTYRLTPAARAAVAALRP